MWTSKLFWKILLASVGPILLTAAALAWIVSVQQEKALKQELLGRLQVSALLLGSAVVDADRATNTDEEKQKVFEVVKRLGKETDTRYTVIDLDGTVIADSEKATYAEVVGMENHASRPEIRDAIVHGSGVSERFSRTMMRDFIYVAVHSTTEPDAPVMRASISMDETRQQVNQMQQLIWQIAGTVSVIAVIVTAYLVSRIVRPILRLTAAAEAMAANEDSHEIVTGGRDELGTLASSFKRMRSEVVRRISELRSHSEQMSAVLGGMVEGVVAVDADTRIVFANDSAGQLLGFSPAHATGQLLLSIVRDDELHRTVLNVLSSKGVVESRIDNFGPKKAVFVVVATPLPGEPCPGVVVVFDDVTERRRLESLRQEFVANVSHELKTPLSSIKAYSETLREGAINDENNNLLFVTRIEEQATRLQQLIMDLLSIARIESGQQTFEADDVNVQSVIDAIVEHHRATADAKSVRLVVDAAVDPPMFARIDEEALRQILDNLIDNAIKYTAAEGTVTIRLRNENEFLSLHVIDSGIGIESDKQERLFERFYRVDKARSRELGGTGLGLSIVKHLAQFFGGSVGVSSEYGKGSDFWVKLPSSQPTALASENRSAN